MNKKRRINYERNRITTSIDELCKECFVTEYKIDRFNALLTLYIAVKDWSKIHWAD